MALRDHNYAILANQGEEEVGAPNIHLQDHIYARQLPVVQIQPQQEEDREAPEDEPVPDEQEDAPAHDEEQEEAPAHDEEQEEAPAHDEEQEEAPVPNEEQEDGAQEPVIDIEQRTYRTIPGIRLNSKFYVDNLGYKYYKHNLLVNRILLICEQRKNPRGLRCLGSASISRNDMDNRLSIVTPHNHEPGAINLDVPFLRNTLGKRAVDRTIMTPTVRGLYNSEIIKHPQAAINYTFLQAQSRVKRMRQSRRPQLPQDIHELSEMLSDPQNANYASTFQIPSSAFSNQELIVNGVSVGVIFANISAIDRYREELATVEMVGIDGTYYKTLPQVPKDLRCFLTFQVLYKNVAFPMVYALLGSETEETYSAFFTVIRNILPLNYDRIRFVTDYERALMNAVERIFPDCDLLCCRFHFTQSVVRYCHRKINGVLNLVKRHEVAARIFRMVLALPHLPAERGNPGCPNFCMEDGFQKILEYTLQFPEIS